MSSLSIKHVGIVGMTACVPSRVEENSELEIFTDVTAAKKVMASTGIERRHVVEDGTTASDLTIKAVEQLLEDMAWGNDEVDILVYVCTSRDFIAPQTSCILQDRLGLRQDCFVIDLPLGCSGWIYGMSVITSLMSHGSFKKGILVAAETNSTNRSKQDRTVRPLFGDAATATALVYDKDLESPFNYVFGVDGSGYQAVWTKYGGMRYPTTTEALQPQEVEPGVIRKGTDMVVNGMDVFAFAIKQPVRSLKDLIDEFEIDTEQVDYLVLHQANKFIDEKIRKAIKLPPEKVPYCLEDYGNVTSASIPLAMVSRLQEALMEKTNRIIACGFGVGLAWASMEFHTQALKRVHLINY